MALYELRTYTLRVGAMADAVKLYQELGFPALQRGGQDKKLVGYFQADTGTINQLVHLWKFDDDADRRAHWASVYANKDFVDGFASKFRPLLITQEVKLLQAAPWGPHPSHSLGPWNPRSFSKGGPAVRIPLAPAESPRLPEFQPPMARSRLFARVCGPWQAAHPAETGIGRRHGTTGD